MVWNRYFYKTFSYNLVSLLFVKSNGSIPCMHDKFFITLIVGKRFGKSHNLLTNSLTLLIIPDSHLPQPDISVALIPQDAASKNTAIIKSAN